MIYRAGNISQKSEEFLTENSKNELTVFQIYDIIYFGSRSQMLL